jgi:hypothetical protein
MNCTPAIRRSIFLSALLLVAILQTACGGGSVAPADDASALGADAETSMNMEVALALANSSVPLNETQAPGAVPTITSPLAASATVGVPFSYMVTASNSPNRYYSWRTPALSYWSIAPGLGGNGRTGEIFGKPTEPGVFTIALKASNSNGVGPAAILTLTVAPAGGDAPKAVPVITSPLEASAVVGQPFQYQIAGSNSPTTFAASRTPSLGYWSIAPGLTGNSVEGLIFGTPSEAGIFTINISAANAVGTGTALMTLRVTPPAPAPSAGTSQEGVAQGLVETKICTAQVTGTRTFNVQSDADALAVPWGTLVGGDVVNVYYKPTPYRVKIGLRAQATTAVPVIINGVTNTACDKPVFDFKDARTSPGSSNVFSSTPAYGESLGGIVIKRGTADAWNGPKPSGIIIQGLELRGAASGNSYTTLSGARASYGAAAAVYVHVGADITLQNVTITDSGFGLFVMAKDDSLASAGERIVLRNSRAFGNGIVGSYLEHNVYMQAASPLTEGNYFGQLRAGAEGSTYKDRSAGAVFRRNVVVASARAIDFVHSEEQSNGIAKLPNYGTDYVYENEIISSGPEAIHYGGDNFGEQEGGLAVLVPPLKYRSNLFFWKNTFTLTTNRWRASVFDLSLKDTTVSAWNNTFDLRYTGGGGISWMEWAGVLKLGTNIIIGSQPVKNRDGAVDSMSVLSTGNAVPLLPPGL